MTRYGHAVSGEYEAPLFGAYSKKVGMWLFLASDSLTFGALLFAFSYNRIYTTPWPTPFHRASIINATIMTACLLSSSLTMVHGRIRGAARRQSLDANLAARHHGVRHGVHRPPRHGVEQADQRRTQHSRLLQPAGRFPVVGIGRAGRHFQERAAIPARRFLA